MLLSRTVFKLTILSSLLFCLQSLAQTPPNPPPSASTGNSAENPPPLSYEGLHIKPTLAPTKASLGSVATLDLPAGYQFLNGSDTQKLMKALVNPVSGQEVGMVEKTSGSNWMLVIEYSPVGYVKDEEKDQLDADNILESMRRNQAEFNKTRAQQNLPPIQVEGWEVKPNYNPQTKNLEWATRLNTNGVVNLNYMIKVLGREGVMEFVLIVDPQDLSTVLPEVRQLITQFSYVPGKRYEEWKPGDKVAEYGLIGLITGGTLAVALKSGLLQKFLKPIIGGVVLLGAGIAKFAKKIFSRNKEGDFTSVGK